MEARCTSTGQIFSISETEQKYCHEHGIPLPQTEPYTLLRWLQSFRNRVHLYNAICAHSGKSILSCFPPEGKHTVYDADIWNGEQWNALDYGREYDFSRPFFDQFNELLHQVPLPNLLINFNSSDNNSRYVNGARDLLNCYLCFTTLDCQDCMFCWNVFYSKDVLDCVYCSFCEICYSSVDLDHCYNVSFSQTSVHCSDSTFLYNCQACKNCHGCVNLSNKEYCWYNEQKTEAEFRKLKAELNLANEKILRAEEKKFAEFKSRFPRKYYQGKNIENCSGNYLLNSKNCHVCYLATGSEDLEHCVMAVKSKDSFGTFSTTESELIYHSVTGRNYNNQFCLECIHTQNLRYCMYCVNGASDCFGCVGLKKNSYCILNKQYTKEEYFALLARIQEHMIKTGEWSDFFPQKLSPFYYNHSDAITFFPLTKDQALAQGFTWKDEIIEPTNTIYQIPDDIADVSEDILQKTLTCELTGKPYRITKQELEFYRGQKLPIPRIAPIERILTRSQTFVIKPLTIRKCDQCQSSLDTIYSEPTISVLCEQCYLEMYQ
ncbi:MAG: hypothetical protein HY817_00045 [Candidatus Abawacabacteria bacterium]|nr:hypothetical protein [Candidatus Abawacabacteria bacterium]